MIATQTTIRMIHSNHISGYFIDSYGMTFATEDRSEIFGTAIDDYN